MARRATLRASDADRDQVAERLRHATAEGRLVAEELEERLEAVFAARTYGELDALVADLPGQTIRRREKSQSAPWMKPLPIILALVFLGPVLVSVMIAVAVVVATLFSAWGLLLIVGWLAFGHGRRYYWRHYHRSLHAASKWPTAGASRPWPWV